ncbi:hypothetical protein [Nocardioides endophyticus]
MAADSSTGATLVHEDSGVIETEYSCLPLRAWDDEPIRVTLPNNNTLLTVLDPGGDAEGFVVNTADQWGPFAVTTRLYDRDPGDPGGEWEDVVEVSLTTGEAVVVTELVDNEPQVDLLPEAGQYRLRACARGRSLPAIGEDEDLDEEDVPPKEWYLLEAWPAPSADPVVVRLTSPHALHELNPPPALVIPEGEAGLAAAARIGRDVDAAPGARTLSGELGSVHVERTIRGTRRRLFDLCAHLTTWSSQWVEGSSWMLSGGPAAGGDWEAPGGTGMGWSHDHADQLTGTTGCVHWTFTEVEKPHRAVRDWQWLYNANRPNPTWTERVPVLAEPSHITVTLVQSRDEAGEPWTTITIDHELLPLEWVDDMHTYWGYQLSIADHAAFGVPK